MMTKKTVPLPNAIIPFILSNLEGFDVVLEAGERIVIVPKLGAVMRPASRGYLARTLIDRANRSVEADQTSTPIPRQVMRPKFIYRPVDARHTPEQAKRFGLSKPRLLVYGLVHAAGMQGIGYQKIRELSKLQHGSVMQILAWLRKQKLITGEPDTTTTTV